MIKRTYSAEPTGGYWQVRERQDGRSAWQVVARFDAEQDAHAAAAAIENAIAAYTSDNNLDLARGFKIKCKCGYCGSDGGAEGVTPTCRDCLLKVKAGKIYISPTPTSTLF